MSYLINPVLFPFQLNLSTADILSGNPITIPQMPAIGANQYYYIAGQPTLYYNFNSVDFDLTDVDLNEPTLPTKDFATYTQTAEQNILFTKIDNVIKAIEQLEKLNKVVYKAPLVNAFAFMLHYDLSTQKLTANPSYILGNMRS